jgi:hypothetical protein
MKPKKERRINTPLLCLMFLMTFGIAILSMAIQWVAGTAEWTTWVFHHG